MITALTESLWWSAAGCTMLHFLWVGVVIGLLTLIGRTILRRAPLSARYAFTMCSLLVLVAAPCLLFVDVAHRMSQQEHTRPVALAGAPDSENDLEQLMKSGSLPMGALAPSGALTSPDTKPPTGWESGLTDAVTTASSLLPWIWITGAATLIVALVAGLVETQRAKTRTRPLNDAQPAARLARRLAADLGVGDVDVRLSDRVASPTVCGIVRPIVLLPASALALWNADQLKMVLLHELWHVRRRDNIANFVQRLIESALFFHPVVWRISAWLRAEREYCCDSAVLHRMEQPLAYAEILAALAGGNRARERLAVAMGEHNLVARIRHVLDRKPPQARVLPALTAAIVLVAGVSSLAWAGRARPEWITVPEVKATTRSESPPSAANDAQSTAPREAPDERDDTASPPIADASAEAAAARHDGVVLHLVDERGRPVAGAQLGIRAKWTRGQLFVPDDAGMIVSDPEGVARIVSKELLQPVSCDPTVPCFAFHAARQLAGALSLTLEDWGSELVVVMRPVVNVSLTINSTELSEAGGSLQWSKAFVRLPANQLSYLLRDTREAPHVFEFPLPPGRYELVTFGGTGRDRETNVVVQCFDVPAGVAEWDLGVIDLPARTPSAGHAGQAQPAAGITE